jgi:hypothetical protein
MYPVAFEADYVEKRSRATTFFRFLLTIPWFFVAILWGLGAMLATFCAWFAIVVTGRYPQGLYAFNAKALRFYTRVDAFQHLLTDVFPPFNGDEDPAYPIRLVIAPPKERYSRWKVLLRGLLMLPIIVVLYLIQLLQRTIGVLSWIVIVVIGRQPKGLFDVTKMCVAYQSRANAYQFLLTETYPPLSADDGAAPGPGQAAYAAAG